MAGEALIAAAFFFSPMYSESTASSGAPMTKLTKKGMCNKAIMAIQPLRPTRGTSIGGMLGGMTSPPHGRMSTTETGELL